MSSGQISFEDLLKLGGVIVVAFFLFSVFSAIANSVQNIQTSLDALVSAFIPLIILAAFFELIRKVFK